MARAAIWAPRHAAADFDSIESKPAYAVGDRIARFTLFAQSGTEIVTGGDDKHLDFRVSVRKLGVQDATQSPCRPWLAAQCLRPRLSSRILPFHRFGVRAILANAVAAGRI